MHQWLGKACPSLEGVDENIAWGEGSNSVENLLAESHQLVRVRQRDEVDRSGILMGIEPG